MPESHCSQKCRFLQEEITRLQAAIAELNERLHERTQGFLARQIKDKKPAAPTWDLES